MSAEALRKAAEKLREQSGSAMAGPWWTDGITIRGGAEGRGVASSTNADRANAAHIATMHPGVGLALADVLDESAAVWDDIDVGTVVRDDSQLDRLARLARMILGGAL